MGLNGMGLSSLVMARRIMGYVDKYIPKVEKPNQRQPSAYQTPKEDQAFIQGQDISQKKGEQKNVQPLTHVEPSVLEINTYARKHAQPGVEQVIPPGKTIKRQA